MYAELLDIINCVVETIIAIAYPTLISSVVQKRRNLAQLISDAYEQEITLSIDSVRIYL
jgi:hypothetical protein